jgi:DNA-binding CsgD family transcriptional regulator
MSRDRKWAFSFENLCDALGFSPERLRRRLADDVASLETLRHEEGRNGTWSGMLHSAPLSRTARVARNAAIVKRRAEGAKLTEIARAYGLSPGHVANICSEAARRADSPPVAKPILSPRERTIVRLLALGFGTREIAGQLGISPLTIQVHVNNVLRNLGFRERRALVAYARRAGLLEPPDGRGNVVMGSSPVAPRESAARSRHLDLPPVRAR